MENYDKDDDNEIQSKNELLKDCELEKHIEILQNAIHLLKSQRKELERETEIINKRIKFLKQKERQIKLHCKKQIDQLHKTVEIKKKRLQDEILMEQKKNKKIDNNRQLKDNYEFNFQSDLREY